MVDITACADKWCPNHKLCYRYTCEKDTYQSFFARSPRKKGQMRCGEFWGNERSEISFGEYNKICVEIIRGNKSIDEMLSELLAIAGQYTLKGAKKPKIQLKVCKKRRLSPKGVKSVAVVSTVSTKPCDGLGERSNRSSHPKRRKK